MSRTASLAVVLTLSLTLAQAQEDYQKTFGKDYEKAISFLQKEKWIDSVITTFGLKPKEVKAIVFPELIRFNSLQDKIETFALETLYVQYGKAYANFSIGPFQIKPSFAENIEVDFISAMGGKAAADKLGVIANDTLSSETNRSSRVKRMKDKTKMVAYLCAFVKIMERRFPTKQGEEKIRFFATAYNCGYRKSEDEINSFQKKKFFQTGFGNNTRYNYADISWFYYSH